MGVRVSVEFAVIRDELAAEYLRNPDKAHLRKYLRDQLEEDLGV